MAITVPLIFYRPKMGGLALASRSGVLRDDAVKRLSLTVQCLMNMMRRCDSHAMCGPDTAVH